ncbi:hypothetical protein Enr8_35570 [Blastopirellula retiformator]|uniref:Uncharacterized protein n=1 Tax=Blastopirellula retiformator TaxID=2527970 RepID=A0A5C5V0Z1_9BACT|nr:hypothetical protein [Blastopirellula retiformator]TWT31633.1 hypothetical protein Enr8_35570 [Blastopirellula retiformator]
MLEKLKEQEGVDPIDVEQAVADLATYSLAMWTDYGEGIQVHRLVEEITRFRLPEVAREENLLTALEMVNASFPNESSDVRF